MSDLSRIGVAIDSALLDKFDQLIAKRGYTNRSEAFRDLIRDELYTMAKTVETMAVRVERIESGVGEGDARLGELRADLRSTMRRDMREILETGRPGPSP